jgi:UDP-N-acetyl-D-mannosaminuronic acid dehydrogenase
MQGGIRMKITMIGLGYIGLPNALLLARAGNEVVGVDVKKDVVVALNNGDLPFEEPGLEELFEEAAPNFRASTEIEPSDCYMIAVPTPLDKEMKMADLSFVRSACEGVAGVISDGDLVILESTIPPGTSRNFVMPLLTANGAKKIGFAHCPERAIPGKTLEEMRENDRIVGGIDERSTERAAALYGSFVRGSIYRTDVTTAEFVKLMENTYRDINIALANEFALISEEVGIDVWTAIDLANKHPRVDILKPGPGVGGHCIAIDPWFMITRSSRSRLINMAREINDFMAIHVVRRAAEMLKDVSDPVITILGMAYKANVDDMRETPALKIARIAENDGIKVRLHDPHIDDFDGNIREIDQAVRDSDMVILVTDHEIFREIDPSKLLMRRKNLVDTRGFLDHERWREAGFKVAVLGKGEQVMTR